MSEMSLDKWFSKDMYWRIAAETEEDHQEEYDIIYPDDTWTSRKNLSEMNDEELERYRQNFVNWRERQKKRPRWVAGRLKRKDYVLHDDGPVQAGGAQGEDASRQD